MSYKYFTIKSTPTTINVIPIGAGVWLWVTGWPPLWEGKVLIHLQTNGTHSVAHEPLYIMQIH